MTEIVIDPDTCLFIPQGTYHASDCRCDSFDVVEAKDVDTGEGFKWSDLD
jgi:hypothetical protein